MSVNEKQTQPRRHYLVTLDHSQEEPARAAEGSQLDGVQKTF